MQVIQMFWFLIFAGFTSFYGFDTLSKLEGTWIGKAGKDDYLEIWYKSGPNFSGSSQSRSGEKLLSEEKMKIFTDRGKIVYRVSVTGQAEVDFSLEKMTPDSLWFSNLSHDYPKHIVYAFKKDSLVACISGHPFGQRFQTFRLKRK